MTEQCDRCPPGGVTFYEGKEWTCRECGTTWRGNALDHDGPLIEPVEGR